MSLLSASLAFVPPALEWAHPIIQEWFVSRFGTPTEPQEQGWPNIVAGRTTLIAAPTGSGKTLAAFLSCIDRLVRKALAGDLQDRTEVLYISPLKALGNDIQKNLEVPLREITEIAGRRGLLMPEIRTAVRTGDTLMHERRAMLKRPPHILVTTPESLYILLTAEKSREVLKDVATVIVDEIHAVAGDKRGAHLALSLERLDALIAPRAHQAHYGLHVVEKNRKLPLRIGLSATQKPISTIAGFLTGTGRREPAIVDVGHRRELDLQIEVPASELGPVASNEMWGEIYDRIAELVRQHRSTLVFVNTRRLAERVAHHLAERLDDDAVAAHHGSLSRKLRLTAEHKLKTGQIRVLVATASLQLGIDIGFVDLVCQIGSPRAINVALQRIGRAGHWPSPQHAQNQGALGTPNRGAIPRGRIFATTRDELLECAALVRAIREGDLDRILVPEAPLDVLAQQIVAVCSAEEWKEDELFALARRAYSYRELTREDFDALITMLSDGIAARRGRFGAFLHRDRVNSVVRGRRGSRLAAIMSGGAIPETALYQVQAEPEGVVVGTVDEDFAVESLAGDIFLLGNSSWRIRRVEGRSGRILVEDAHGAPPNIPFWRGEAPARTAELSSYVGGIREQVSRMTPTTTPVNVGQEADEVRAALDWLQRECGLDQSGAEQALEYIVAGRAALGAVPSQKIIVAERFFDEAGGMQLVIHAPFGGRVNRAWGLALRKRFCRSFNFELQAAATDDGLNISLAEQHSFPLGDVFHFLQPETVQSVLEQAALASPIFGTRFRWDATRALALLRFRGGNKVPPQIQRMLSDDLLAAVFPDVAACQENVVGDIQIPDHPLVKEVMKDVLTEAMDLEGLRVLLRGIEGGSIRTVAVDTPVPSQFSHEILNANPYAYLDDAPLEERRARAVTLRRTLPEAVLEEVGKLDPAAIAQVREEAWPDIRDADELHDALLTFVAFPEQRNSTATGRDGVEAQGFSPAESMAANDSGTSAQVWHACFDQLASADRSGIAVHEGRRYWIAAERARSFHALFPDACFETALPDVEPATPSRQDVLLATVTGWMQHIGPTTANALSRMLGLSAPDVEQALLRLEAAGSVLRGKFTGATDELEWCDRRLLARIHRLTVGRLRREIEPVTSAQFMRWLLRWQHVAPGTQVRGDRGVLEIVQQLQGFEIPANAWERQVLARRIADYDPKFLDQLCLTGAVGWGRLSPHPATLDDSAHGRRVVPTSVAPITFFVREESDWMPAQHVASDQRALTHGARQAFEFLQQRGASFFADIVRGTERLKSEVETALWELVAAGLVTADGFDNLRALIDPKRRAGHGHGRLTRPRHSAGRWSLLYASEDVERTRAVEATCWMLLRRYGVVFRELLARESILPKWRELVVAFRRLEDRGEVRGGRFVSSFIGEQFALPLAVESLRALRKQQPTGETITLSAADPLNLVGIIVPGERVSAVSGKVVPYYDGVPVAIEENPLRIAAS